MKRKSGGRAEGMSAGAIILGNEYFAMHMKDLILAADPPAVFSVRVAGGCYDPYHGVTKAIASLEDVEVKQ